MARRSQCSSAGDNPLDPNYLAPHYREEYRLAIDALVEADVEGYYGFLQEAKVVDFLSRPEIEYIKCMVVAVAMDMFTDVDIFADILNAAMRNVAVYVLLDELNAHHFVAMANNCSVNLDEIKFLRVRTVSGNTYFCHTGMSFKGQMTNRFVLVDCRIVLSGNYSFTWSFEKIHRYIAHVFLGELVATFDEEFRILYAHSEPLVTESPVTYVEDYGNLTGRHNMGNTQIFHNASIEDIHAEWPGQSVEDQMNLRPMMIAFRKETDILEHNPSEVCQPVSQVVTETSETFLDTPQSSSCSPHDPESEERTDEDQDKDPGSEERTDEDQDKDPGSEERKDEDQDKDPGSEERTDKDQDKDPGSEERTDENQDKDPGSEERTDENQDKDTGSEERSDKDQDKDPGSEERTDEDQDKDPIKEQTQQQKESCDSERYLAVEVSTDLGNDRTDDIKEAALGEGAGSSNAEKPQETQPCTDVLNHQPLMAKKPAHQSSTVNVLSCSNLRDDTKVLLEQISAKNQGRASKMSATHHAKQDEADGNTRINKQISGHT
ncbi:hypothetical protein NFI96_017202, partial [Prochilodus magdalenae]